MKKKIFCTLSSVVMVFCVLTASLSVGATVDSNSSIQPFWIGLSSLKADLIISSFGLAECDGEVKLKNGYTADMTMELQRSTNLAAWETVNSWTASGGGTLELNKSYYVATGYYYRVEVSADVYNAYGTLIESPSKTSSIVY